MSFELPESVHDELVPLEKELVDGSIDNWMVPLDKLEALVEGDEGLKELLEDLLDQCFRYTKSVLEHLNTQQEEGFGEESSQKADNRTKTHNATQDTIRAFVRNLIKAGKSKEQVHPLLPNPESRPACGSFALRLTLSRGIESSD